MEDITDTGAETPEVLDGDSTSPEARDYEAEARAHGWTPKDEFKGDQSKWVDAEAFVRRADEVMPFLKKQNAGLKREIDDLKRQVKKASDFFSKAQERAYAQAMADLEARMGDAVDAGDRTAAQRITKEMRDLSAEAAAKIDDAAPAEDPKAAERKFAEWVENNDWYVTDENKRAYADIQANAMGLATEWEGGPEAWLAELGKRVERKFAEKKPVAVNGGGNRSAPSGGKSFSDLPAEAKAMCDKWVRQGLIPNRETYVKSYQW